MYGQNGRKNLSREVTLTRVKPYDSRTVCSQGAGRERKGIKAAAAAFMIMTFTFVCAGAVLFSLGGSQGAEIIETAQGNMSEIIMPDPVQISREEPQEIPPEESQEAVVVLADEEHTPRIAIDPGHGGEDEGCSQKDVLEKEINLELALLLEENLQELGFETILIRKDDTQMTLQERVQCAQDAKADIYVSIHQNSCEGKNTDSVSGIETWYCGDSRGSRRLAQLVHKGAVEKTGARDREVKETDELYVVRETAIPSCLIETGFLTNGEERQALASPEYQKKLAEGIAQGIDLFFNPKIMYLTFDDGPSQENTAKVLDILKEHDIKATFFLVGENVKKRPEMAKRIVEEGHTIGIHCYSHDYKEIYKSVDAYLEDFQKAYDVILETTGVEVQLFRFPGGSINSYNQEVYQDIIKKMTEKGYIYYDWNACLSDAVKHSTPEQLVQNGVSTTRGRKKVVMLCHDVIYNTTLCLEDLLDSLPEYRMEPLTPEVKPIQF